MLKISGVYRLLTHRPDNFAVTNHPTNDHLTTEMMLDEVFYHCGAYEIIMMLHELHNRGYEQLRLFSGMSPSGLYWRWSIYPKMLMKANAEIERLDFIPFECPRCSVGIERSNDDFKAMADALLHRFKSLFDIAKAPDPEYVAWYQNVVRHAQGNTFPIAFEEYFDAEQWQFTNGEPLPYPPFEPTDIGAVDDEAIIAYALDYYDEFSRHSINEVIRYNGVKPARHEMAETIRKAYTHDLELFSHDETASYQTLAYHPSEIVSKTQTPDGLTVKLTTGEEVHLRDTIDLFAVEKIE